MKIFNRKRKEVEIPPVAWPPPSLKKLLAYNRKVSAEQARHGVKTELLPKIQQALETDKYDFIAKNELRIYTMVEKMTLEGPILETRIITIRWS